MAALEADFASGTEPYRAGYAFFSQSPRATRMAVGEVFTDPLPAQLVSSTLSVADIAALALISDGSMVITWDNGDSGGPSTLALAALDFSGVTTIEGISAVINAATDANINCSVITLPGGSKHLKIYTVATGDDMTILYPSVNLGGTYVGELLNLSAIEGGQIMNGYTPGTLADELTNIANAADAAGKYIYGWVLGASLRDTTNQESAAEWALARKAVMPLVSNDPNAKDAAYTLDLGYLLEGNKRVFPIYHDDSQQYPDMSILAYMLHVNYGLQDSTVTAKFKNLPGITTVKLTESEWAVLQGKGYNTYTAIGNSARTFRDGTSEESSWFMDTVINLDNFEEDLSVALYNVFLRNKKVPYTRLGQMLFVDACSDVGTRYTFNGAFADREEASTTSKSGVVTVPAVQVIPAPISGASAADRAGRVGPPIQMIVQEAGAIHSIAVNVEVVS
jgi:hypothetical protein